MLLERFAAWSVRRRADPSQRSSQAARSGLVSNLRQRLIISIERCARRQWITLSTTRKLVVKIELAIFAKANADLKKANKIGSFFVIGDAGARTPDPLLAKQVLYQLSYIPTQRTFVPSDARSSFDSAQDDTGRTHRMTRYLSACANAVPSEAPFDFAHGKLHAESKGHDDTGKTHRMTRYLSACAKRSPERGAESKGQNDHRHDAQDDGTAQPRR